MLPTTRDRGLTVVETILICVLVVLAVLGVVWILSQN